MSTDKIHGGLIERAIAHAQSWLRLAATSVTSATIAAEQGLCPASASEFHKAASERYLEAARQAERVAEGCRIQAQYHQEMAAARGMKEREP